EPVNPEPAPPEGYIDDDDMKDDEEDLDEDPDEDPKEEPIEQCNCHLSLTGSFFIISSIAVQTPGSGISNLLAVGKSFTSSGNLYCQWELSPGSGNAFFFVISSIAVQTPDSGISNLLAVGSTFTGSGNLYCQWELSPGSGNALCILFPTAC
nr:hypothetical protein [Tanacetum cinerariifolium]